MSRARAPGPIRRDLATWACSPGGTLGLLAGWATGHGALRLALSSALTADDAREAVLAQSLAWGYQARQPPLYNWLAWGAVQLLGPSLLALTVLKYAVLVLGFWLVSLTARRILVDPRHATLATFSFLLVIPISWTVHEALTHSVAVIAACAGTAWALARLADVPRPGAYAVLGIAVGLGVLSKFTYLVFLGALGLAALTVGRIRARLLDRRVAIAVLTAGVLVLPYALWFLGQGHDLARLFAQEVQPEEADGWASAAAGLADVARIVAFYLALPAAALALCFPAIFRPLPPGPDGPPGGRLLGRLLGAILLLLVAGALAGVLGTLKPRWLIPGFLLAPLYAFWRLERHGRAPGRVRVFVLVLVLAEVGVTGGLALRVLRPSLFPRPYRMNEPYDAIADGLRRAGFRRGTIVAGFGTLAGNLRVRFPDSRVLHVEYADFQPPAIGGGQCLLVWTPRHLAPDAAPRVPDDLRALAAAVGVPLTGSEIPETLAAPFHRDPRHVRRVHFLLFPDGAGGCR